uniref:NADH-ubiquinone oxidoreductase chain 5 n=1 Tax=Ascobulla fragilis TaxID=195875 RepID=B3DFB6_ASCFR|nr:NADH dehydrogenase subunit 5 [Ascobulla fragilis]ACE62803.1 NADH dehydrogenase subunit 5 [Ascobulla fragilis]
MMLFSCFIIASVYSFLFFYISECMILEIELMSISSVNFGFTMVIDKISLSFSAVVTIISSSVFTFAYKYMEEDPFASRFFWILLSFVISMNMLIFAGSIFFLFLGWDGLGITSFALIIYYEAYESLSAGFQTLMVNRLGDALIVLSSCLFVFCGQFSYLSLSSVMLSSGLVMLLAFAGLTKSAQYPFSSWLPAAMAAPTPVSALVHSSTLVTAGIYLIIRLSHSFSLSSELMTMLLFFGSITCLLGGWAATYENDLKKIIALSTLSQLGVMVFCLGLGLSSLALFHLYTHALFKALLFMAAGHILMASFGCQDIRLLGSVGVTMPLTAVMFNISSFCLVGAPFLSAFYSKHLILEKMFMSSLSVFSVVLMMVGTFFTAKYVTRSLKCILWWKSNTPLLGVLPGFFTSVPMIFLGVGGVMGGKFLSLIDLSNMELAYIPSLLGSSINITTVSGMLCGLVSFSYLKSNFNLSSLFFLTPLISMSSKLMSPTLKHINVLDYGWLEPSYLMQQKMNQVGVLCSGLFSWPTSKYSLFRGLMMFGLIL